MRARTILIGVMVCLSCGPVAPETLSSQKEPSSFSSWSTPVNVGPVVNTAASDHRPAVPRIPGRSSPLSLYFGSNRPGSVGTAEGTDLYVSKRATEHDPWGPAQKVEALSSPGDDNAPTFSLDGHWMYFGSNRPGGCGGFDLWASHRQDVEDDFGWEPPVNLGCHINSASDEDGPTYFEADDGTATLYFTRKPGGLGDWDIYASTALAKDHVSFGPAVLVRELSSDRRDTRPSIRPDGLEIFIVSNRVGSVPDANGVPSLDIWVATRASTAEAWSTPVNLGPPINTPALDGGPCLSFDGEELFFDSDRAGGLGSRDLYSARRSRVGGN
jgi:hypothetical protein